MYTSSSDWPSDLDIQEVPDLARPHSSLGYRPPAPKVLVSDNKTKEYYQTIISTH